MEENPEMGKKIKAEKEAARIMIEEQARIRAEKAAEKEAVDSK